MEKASGRRPHAYQGFEDGDAPGELVGHERHETNESRTSVTASTRVAWSQLPTCEDTGHSRAVDRVGAEIESTSSQLELELGSFSTATGQWVAAVAQRLLVGRRAALCCLAFAAMIVLVVPRVASDTIVTKQMVPDELLALPPSQPSAPPLPAPPLPAPPLPQQHPSESLRQPSLWSPPPSPPDQPLPSPPDQPLPSPPDQSPPSHPPCSPPPPPAPPNGPAEWCTRTVVTELAPLRFGFAMANCWWLDREVLWPRTCDDFIQSAHGVGHFARCTAREPPVPTRCRVVAESDFSCSSLFLPVPPSPPQNPPLPSMLNGYYSPAQGCDERLNA